MDRLEDLLLDAFDCPLPLGLGGLTMSISMPGGGSLDPRAPELGGALALSSLIIFLFLTSFSSMFTIASVSFSLVLSTRAFPISDVLSSSSNLARHSAVCVRTPMVGLVSARHPTQSGVGPCSSTSFLRT